jgi:hypothetical protein
VYEKSWRFKGSGVKRHYTRMKGTTKWTRTVSGVKVIHGP